MEQEGAALVSVVGTAFEPEVEFSFFSFFFPTTSCLACFSPTLSSSSSLSLVRSFSFFFFFLLPCQRKNRRMITKKRGTKRTKLRNIRKKTPFFFYFFSFIFLSSFQKNKKATTEQSLIFFSLSTTEKKRKETKNCFVHFSTFLFYILELRKRRNWLAQVLFCIGSVGRKSEREGQGGSDRERDKKGKTASSYFQCFRTALLCLVFICLFFRVF